MRALFFLLKMLREKKPDMFYEVIEKIGFKGVNKLWGGLIWVFNLSFFAFHSQKASNLHP